MHDSECSKGSITGGKAQNWADSDEVSHQRQHHYANQFLKGTLQNVVLLSHPLLKFLVIPIRQVYSPCNAEVSKMLYVKHFCYLTICKAC